MNERTPDALLRVAGFLCVTSNFAFLPHRRVVPVVPGETLGPDVPLVMVGVQKCKVTPPLTLCNDYATCFAAAFGAELPPMKANDQWLWLQSNEAKMKGWRWVPDRKEAQQRVRLGALVAVVARNILGHGHIAMGVPSMLAPSEFHVTAAGASTYVNVRLETSFGALASSALFFEHLLTLPQKP